MVTFDQALPTLVYVCEQTAAFSDLKVACAVRDLRGRIRLVIDPDPGKAPVDVAKLQASLEQELGKFFVAPIWSTLASKSDEARLARAILDQAKVWDDPAYEDASGSRHTASARWKKLERRLSKQEWLETAGGELPWKLGAQMPSIVTFYSFKGGVGRTTALAACAWQLARAGKKVVVIDLDLEAPGLGTLLEARRDRGVIDFLVDHVATGSNQIELVIARADAFGDDGDRVQVISAGKLDQGYLEKLGRLDFISQNPPAVNRVDGSPIEQALRALLFAVLKSRPRPDYILIDSRAGLHDLAGLSLHRLAHVDVLVGRASEQGYQGLDLTLGVLAKRKGVGNLQYLVVHGIAPAMGSLEAITEEQEFRAESYRSFVKHVYDQPKAETIGANDDGIHVPIVIHREVALERFVSLRAIERALFAPGFVELRKKIEALCAP